MRYKGTRAGRIVFPLLLVLASAPIDGVLAAGLDAKESAQLLEAKQLYKSGKYEEAAALYSRLSAAHPELPVFARNAGAAYYYLRRPEPSLSNLREYVRKQKKLTDDDRVEVERWISEMEQLRQQTPLPMQPSAPATATTAGPPAATPNTSATQGYPSPPATPSTPAAAPYPASAPAYPGQPYAWQWPNSQSAGQVPQPYQGQASPQNTQPYPAQGYPSAQVYPSAQAYPAAGYAQPAQPYPAQGYSPTGQPYSPQAYPAQGYPPAQTAPPYPQAAQAMPPYPALPASGEPTPSNTSAAQAPSPAMAALDTTGATSATGQPNPDPFPTQSPNVSPAEPQPIGGLAAASVEPAHERSALPWIVGGASLGTLALGGVFTYLYLSNFSDTQKQYNPGKESNGQAFSALQFVCYGVGTAGVVTAIILATHARSSRNAVTVVPTLAPQMAGASLHLIY